MAAEVHREATRQKIAGYSATLEQMSKSTGNFGAFLERVEW